MPDPARKRPATPPVRDDSRFPRTVVTVGAVIAVAACFAFNYGNVYALGLLLEAPWWVAATLPPAADATLVALLVGLRHLSNRGLPARTLRPARLMMFAAGATVLILNVATAAVERRWAAVAYDSVAPLLLIGWAEVGPWFLRQFRATELAAAAGSAATGPAAEPATPPPPSPQGSADRGSDRRSGNGDRPRRPATAGVSSAPIVAAAVQDLAGDGEISLQTRRQTIVTKIREHANGQLEGVTDRTVEANALAALRELADTPPPPPPQQPVAMVGS